VGEAASELPPRQLLELDLVRILMEPPDLAAGRDLVREIGRRLKRPVSPLLVAEGLLRLTPKQRGSRPQDRAFVRSALLQRLQQAEGLESQPIVVPPPEHRHDESGDLEDGTWSWRDESYAVVKTDKGRWGVLHLHLKNTLDTVGVGQPVAIVLLGAENSFGWSPTASGQVPEGSCPDGCAGSLATVAVEPEAEILGHLSFPLPADVEPEAWGLQVGHHADTRPLPNAAKA
jgi:hypothetical protein